MQHITPTIRDITIQPRPFASIRKIGGLHHWRVGRVGGSFYGLRHTRRILTAATLATAAIIAACTAQPSGPTYSAVVTLQSGDEYRIDHGMSRDDCTARIADMPATDARCEREGSR